MAVTLTMAIVAAVAALGLVVTGGFMGERGERLFSGVSTLTWLLLVACFGAISFEAMYGPAALLVAASLAVSCVLTTGERARNPERAKEQGAVRLGGAFALTLAACALILSANTYYDPVVKDANLILFAGQWAALGAAMAAALLGSSRDPHQRVLTAGGAMKLMMFGAFCVGMMRSTLPTGLGYFVELSSQPGPVRWALPPITPGASSYSFDVVQRVEGVEWILGGGIVLAAVATLLGSKWGAMKRKAAWVMGAAAALAAASLGKVLWSGFGATLPDAAAYAAYARELGVERGIPEQVLAMGRFVHGETVFVLWLDVLADVGLLGGATLLGAMLAYELWRSSDAQASAPGAVAQDAAQDALFLGRSAGFMWLAWFLAMFINWRLHAAYGVASPAEWTLLGGAVCCSGGTLLSLSAHGAIARVARASLVWVVVAVVVVALVFEGVPGVAMR